MISQLEDKEYLLADDKGDLEGKRLNGQHHALVTIFGHKLYQAPITLKLGDRILESGAGSGIWIQDFVKDAPETIQIDAIDISDQLLPEKLPNHVHFTKASITSLPSEWTERFTFVHQRLLIYALSTTTWETAISEIHRVLVPGGWVELLEAVVEIPVVGPHSAKLKTLHEELLRGKSFLTNACPAIPDMLQAKGFSKVAITEAKWPIGGRAGPLGIAAVENLVVGFIPVKTPVMAAGGCGIVSTEEEYLELIKGCEKEWMECEGTDLLFQTIIAQK